MCLVGFTLIISVGKNAIQSINFFFSKCQSYSPNESNKAYEKAVSRKSGILFEPQLVIEEVQSEAVGRRTLKPREEYLRRYLEVRV